MAWIDLQWHFLFSRKTILLMVFFSLISGGIVAYQANLQLGYAGLDLFRDEYAKEFLDNSMMAMKYLSICVPVLLMTQSSTPQACRYAFLLVSGNHKRLPFLLSKWCVFSMSAALFISTQGLFFVIVTIGFTPYHYPLEMLFSLFGSVLLEALCFCFFQAILMKLTGLALSAFIPLGLFWLLELYGTQAVMERQSWVKALHYIFPHVMEIDLSWGFYHPKVFVIGALCFWALLSTVIHLRMDL
jgi:hypothetical protein